MRRICPFLLGAVLIALICASGGLAPLDRMLEPAVGWLAGLLPATPVGAAPAAPFMVLDSRELAPVAALLCLVLGPLFHRWSWLPGGLLFAAASAIVVSGATAAAYAGAALAPGGLLGAIVLALLVGSLARLDEAENDASGRAGALMPALAEHSTAPIVVFDSDGGIRACNRALGEMFGYAAGELAGTSFGRLLDLPSYELPRLCRRSDGLASPLIGRHRDGRRFHLQAALGTFEWRGERLRVAVLHDVSEVRVDQELVSLTDEATGLCNQVLFHDRIDQAILAADRAQQAVAVMVIHLHLFKLIAETLGRAFADELIGAMVGRIQKGLRRSDTLARLSDTELGLLVPGLADPEQATVSARRVAELTRQPLAVRELELGLEVNIGVAVYPAHGHDKHALLERAEAAMLRARRLQRSVVVHDEAPDLAEDEHELRDNLRAAIEDNLLTVQFLPKLAVQSGRLVGVEALVHWAHPERGEVATGRFLRLAAESGLILPLTLRVLGLTLEQQRIWRTAGWDLAVAINLANGCLQNPQFPNVLAQMLQTAEGQAERLVFEITESALASNQARVLEILQRLAGQGCQLSLDDFGTGSFSLSFLRKLPIHELKIDRSFVEAMLRDADAAAVVRSAISLGQSLDLRVVAAGVEDAATLEALRELRCDEVQGCFIGPPMSADEFAAWLQQSDRAPDDAVTAGAIEPEPLSAA